MSNNRRQVGRYTSGEWATHVIDANRVTIETLNGDRSEVLADVHVPEFSGDQLANAFLMTASPLLLLACRLMRERLTELANKDDHCWLDWIAAYFVDDAIAAATGQRMKKEKQ